MKPTLRPRGTPRQFIGVHGLLTQQRLTQLGYESVPVIGDAGLSMPQFFNPHPNGQKKVGLIPHYVDVDHPFCDEVRQYDGSIISPAQDLEYYLFLMLACNVIISSSLHGLIFAHAYGIPAIWVKMTDNVVGNGFKFRDYYSYMGVDPLDIPIWDPARPFGSNLDSATCPSAPQSASQRVEMLWDSLVEQKIV